MQLNRHDPFHQPEYMVKDDEGGGGELNKRKEDGVHQRHFKWPMFNYLFQSVEPFVDKSLNGDLCVFAKCRCNIKIDTRIGDSHTKEAIAEKYSRVTVQIYSILNQILAQKGLKLCQSLSLVPYSSRLSITYIVELFNCTQS